MEENNTANMLNGIGITIIILGIIMSLVMGGVLETTSYSYSGSSIKESSSYNWGIAIGGSVASIISGILFIGLGEIINLLQQSVCNEREILLKLHNINYNTSNKTKAVNTDIDSTLPDM